MNTNQTATGEGTAPRVFQELLENKATLHDLEEAQALDVAEATCGWIVPPIIEARMTGVQYAKCYASGKVELTYVDGGTESATLTAQQIKDARNNFFSLVGSVQSYRKA